MIRLVSAVRESPSETSRATRWLAIEGDDAHGYLLRAFADLTEPQLHDDWVDTLEAAYEYGEAYGILRSHWVPRQEPLPGALPFPDAGDWVPDNSKFKHG